MSRLDKFDEIMDDYEKRRIDAEAFKRGNPSYKEWLEKLLPAEKNKVEELLSMVYFDVAMCNANKGDTYKDTALYVVGSSVTEDTYNDIDIVLVGMKEEYADNLIQ